MNESTRNKRGRHQRVDSEGALVAKGLRSRMRGKASWNSLAATLVFSIVLSPSDVWAEELSEEGAESEIESESVSEEGASSPVKRVAVEQAAPTEDEASKAVRVSSPSVQVVEPQQSVGDALGEASVDSVPEKTTSAVPNAVPESTETIGSGVVKEEATAEKGLNKEVLSSETQASDRDISGTIVLSKGVEEKEEDRILEQERLGLSVVPQVAFAIGGWTNVDIECETDGSLGCVDESIGGHAEASGLAFALDGIYRFIPALGLGASALWIPSVKGNSGSTLRKLGMEFGLQAVVEGVVDLTEKVSLTGRIQLGGVFQSPKGFAKDQLDVAEQDCQDAVQSGISCTVDDGPSSALTYGAGAGLMWSLGATRVRFDLRYQVQDIALLTQQASNEEGSLEAEVHLDQSRVWMLMGFEL